MIVFIPYSCYLCYTDQYFSSLADAHSVVPQKIYADLRLVYVVDSNSASIRAEIETTTGPPSDQRSLELPHFLSHHAHVTITRTHQLCLIDSAGAIDQLST